MRGAAGGGASQRPPAQQMVEIGYQLSSEEHPARDLVGYARRAEEVGFAYAVISDHYHPWLHRQGQASFVWTVLGALAQATKRLRLGTAVTAPVRRMPPYLVAQAAATAATLLPGRFFLGVGTGENLNEHITGERWPPTSVRREMLEEAVEVIRKLWAGGTVEHFGRHYTVDNARIYSRRPCLSGSAGGDPAAAPAETARPGRLPGRRRTRQRGTGVRARPLQRRPGGAPRKDRRVRRRRLRPRPHPPDRRRPRDVLPPLRTRSARARGTYEGKESQDANDDRTRRGAAPAR